MTTKHVFATLLAFIFTASLYAQSENHCGFNVRYQVFDSIFPNFLFRGMSARENGDQYEFNLYRTPSPTQKQFRRLTTDHQGSLLSTIDFTFDCNAAIVGQDGAFLCASTVETGIRVSKLASTGDTIWTGVFGQPNFIPYNILDMGADGIIITGAEPYSQTVWFPKGFLLKIDANHTEAWMTIHNVLGPQGWFNRVVPSSDGGYFVEALSADNSYSSTWEKGIKFDQDGNLLWQTQLGSVYGGSDIIGMTSDSNGGLLSTVAGPGDHGPSFSCQFYKVDAAGNVLNSDCLDAYLPDVQTYFVNGMSEILPASSGGYLTGLARIVSPEVAPGFVLIRLDAALDTLWTKGFNRSISLSSPLPGDAFLGYYKAYLDSIGLIKIGANGELSPCAPVSAHNPSASNENIIHFSPNPADKELTLSFESNVVFSQEASVQITSLLGKVMRQYKYNNLLNTGSKLNLSDLPAGSYILQAIDAGKTIATKPLVIIH